MSIYVRMIRWALAALAACLGFFVGLLAVARVVKAIEPPRGSDFQWLIYGGTMLAVVTGAAVAPRDQRRLFGKVVVAVLLVGTMGSLVDDLVRHAFILADVYAVVGVAVGGLSAVKCTRDRPVQGITA